MHVSGQTQRALDVLGVVGWHAVARHMNVSVTHASTYVTHIRNAQASRGLRDGIKHGLKIELGSADRAEHLADRSLIFQRFRKFPRARLYLLEQPRVLNGDDGLVSKGHDQLDLLVRKRPYSVSCDRDHTNWISITQQGNSEDGPKTEHLLHLPIRVFRIRQNVGHMNGLACQQGSSDDASAPAFVRDGLYVFNGLRGVAVDRDQIIGIVPLTCDGAHIRFTKARRGFDQSVQDGLQVKRRPAHDLQYVGGGSLLLQGFAQLTEQSRVLDRYDGLAGKALDELDLPIREWPHLLSVDE